jgi:NAD(P)-dependent dehydrogenase (short-subunit alcohol dehydrogenase family)
VAAVADAGGVDLVINNASDLGGSPLPQLRDLEPAAYEQLLRTNVVRSAAADPSLLRALSPHAVVINCPQTGGVDHYEDWGGYGSSKAALDHQTWTWAAEEPTSPGTASIPGYADRDASGGFPGEDISDRPEPESRRPLIVALIDSGLPSGRYRSTDLATTLAARWDRMTTMLASHPHTHFFFA